MPCHCLSRTTSASGGSGSALKSTKVFPLPAPTHKKNRAAAVAAPLDNSIDFFLMIVAASGLPMQAAVADVPQHPDAVRLLGSIIPSGLPLNAPAHVFCGDQWRQAVIVATGLTSCQVSMQRHGLACVHDRRNLLLADEWTSYAKACAKWRRDHKQEAGE